MTINYFDLELVSERGIVLKHHRVSGVRVIRPMGAAPAFVAAVESWSDLQSFLARKPPADASAVAVPEDVALAPLSGICDAVVDWLLTDTDSRFFGAVPQAADMAAAGIEAARDLQWRRVKAWRAAAIASDMPTPHGAFQCRQEDRQNLMGAVMQLQTLAALSTPSPTVDWTLSDNSAVTLTLPQLIEVGLLLGQKINQAHATGRALRAQIDAATTVAEAEAVVWPVVSSN